MCVLHVSLDVCAGLQSLMFMCNADVCLYVFEAVPSVVAALYMGK